MQQAQDGAPPDSRAGRFAPLIGLVAGEASGDHLGAALMAALRVQMPQVEFLGVAGEAMRAAGCRVLAPSAALSVMGLTEVLGHLPRLYRLRQRLVAEFVGARPDLVVGIDSPDFNLGLERRLRAAGIRTAHYVSPSVWVWRPGRVHAVARAAEVVLCLLPFEPGCYDDVPVHAVFTGHPLADELQPSPAAGARAILGLPASGRVLALLPGSRAGEVQRLAPAFLEAAAVLARERSDLRVVLPLAAPELRPIVERARASRADFPLTLTEGRGHTVLRAADVVLAASGTATLEALLLDRPMVAAYRLAPLSAWLLRRGRMLHAEHFALPNLLAGCGIVPELLQEDATVARIVPAVARLLDDSEARRAQREAFATVRRTLGRGAAARAAATVHEMLKRDPLREA